MGSRGRTPTFQTGITEDDNDNPRNYATKGDGNRQSYSFSTTPHAITSLQSSLASSAVGLSPLCLGLESTLVFYEGRVSLGAVAGLGFLILGLLLLSHDSDSEN
nr:hypothetical protein [Tanacetum cinerariifolium]